MAVRHHDVATLGRGDRHVALHIAWDCVRTLPERSAAKSIGWVRRGSGSQRVIPVDLTGIAFRRAVSRGDPTDGNTVAFALHRLKDRILAIRIVGVACLATTKIEAG